MDNGSYKVKARGFTLIEILVYIAIFAVSATFLVGILTVVLKIQNKQGSATEINQQISFVNNTIQRLVQNASLIDNATGMPSATLNLRTSQTSLDPTKIFFSNNVIYLQEGKSSAVALTSSNVKVDNFLVTKYENPGGPAVVQIDLTLSYNSQNPQNQISRTLRTAITRISAATFDSSVVPNSNNSFDLGNPINKWKDGYFSGGLSIYGQAGIGGAPSSDTAIKLKTNGDIFINSNGKSIILKSPDGTCYRLGFTNGGAFATSSLGCPP